MSPLNSALSTVLDILKNAPRVDNGGPLGIEGRTVIILSDELALKLIDLIEEAKIREVEQSLDLVATALESRISPRFLAALEASTVS